MTCAETFLGGSVFWWKICWSFFWLGYPSSPKNHKDPILFKKSSALQKNFWTKSWNDVKRDVKDSNLGAKRAFRKFLMLASQKWISWSSTKKRPFEKALQSELRGRGLFLPFPPRHATVYKEKLENWGNKLLKFVSKLMCKKREKHQKSLNKKKYMLKSVFSLSDMCYVRAIFVLLCAARLLCIIFYFK